MRSSPQTTVVTVLASRGRGRRLPCASAQRGPTRREPHLGDDLSPGQEMVGRKAFDAICEPALIGDGSRLWAIKKDPLVGRRRGRGGMTSLGVDDAESGT